MPSPPVSRKPRGRPRIDGADRSVSVHLTVSAQVYDRMYDAATKDARQSVNEWIRERLDEAVSRRRP